MREIHHLRRRMLSICYRETRKWTHGKWRDTLVPVLSSSSPIISSGCFLVPHLPSANGVGAYYLKTFECNLSCMLLICCAVWKLLTKLYCKLSHRNSFFHLKHFLIVYFLQFFWKKSIFDRYLAFLTYQNKRELNRILTSFDRAGEVQHTTWFIYRLYITLQSALNPVVFL